MAEFLDERLPIDIRMGASHTDDYAVNIVQTAGGAEYRNLVHAYPMRRWTINFTLLRDDLASRVLALYHRAYGKFAGFRVRDFDDYNSSASGRGVITNTDQTLSLVSTGIYQLRKQYGAGGTPLSIGRPSRVIYKPVASTVLVAAGGVSMASFQWSLDASTGRVTFAANSTASISGISKASSAVITFGSAHPFIITQAVHISGVSGMTGINGKRATITGSSTYTITVNIDSTGYNTYSSGGTVNTRPQSETVTAGFEFDIPARFDSAIDVASLSSDVRDCGSIDIVEILNP